MRSFGKSVGAISSAAQLRQPRFLWFCINSQHSLQNFAKDLSLWSKYLCVIHLSLGVSFRSHELAALNSQIDLPAICEKDPLAWAELYDQLGHATFGMIWKLTGGDQMICHELNQETWLSALDQIERFDSDRGTVCAWILGIARNKSLMHLRMASKTIVVATGPASDLNSQATTDESAERKLENQERAAMIHAALALISPQHRDLLHGKYVDGISVKQLAEKFGKTPKSVESMLTRARAQLRDLLRGFHYDFRDRT